MNNLSNKQEKQEFERLILLEKQLSGEQEYLCLIHDRDAFLSRIRNCMSWKEFDDYLSAENAYCFYLMQYFYRQGLKDAGIDFHYK